MSRDDIKNLIAVRGQIKAKITRFETYITSHEGNNVTEIKVRLERFESIYDEFDKIQSKIEMLDDAQASERDPIEARYFSAVAQVRELLASHTNHNQNSRESIETHNQSARSKVCLPIVDLPTFSGEYADWLYFYDSFSSLIHENTSLSNIQKYQYLRSCLKGSAVKTIESLTISEQNYTVVWQALQERFANKRRIVQDQVNKLLNLPFITRESPLGIRQLLDTLKSNLASLKRQNLPVQHWDALIIPIVSSKFDFLTKKEWEGSLNTTDLPTMQQLTEFLTKRCCLIEILHSEQTANKPYNSNNYYRQKQQTVKSQVHSRSASHLSLNKRNCFLCKGDHYLYACSKLLNMSIPQRLTEIKKLKLCTNCFKSNHNLSDCLSGGCKHCHKKHNTLLHIHEHQDHGTDASTSSHATPVVSGYSYQSQPHSQILLSTAIIYIKDKHGKDKKCRALLDAGSQSNFISQPMCQKLGLQPTKINVPISGVNQVISKVNQAVQVHIKSRFNSFSSKINCYVLPAITDNLPTVEFSKTIIHIPPNINLADPDFNVPGPIDLLIGAELFWELLYQGQIRTSKQQPHLQKTHFGWILGGIIPITDTSVKVCNLSLKTLEKQVAHFWDVLEPSENTIYSQEEQKCENNFTQNVTRDSHGRFIVSLPFKSDAPSLGNSRDMALQRFDALERKLAKQPHIKHQYNNFLDEYLHLNHMEIMSESDANNDGNNCYYLPHHAIIKEHSISTRLRVVFDGSAKSSNGISLNDNLLAGPTLQQELFSILLRFRTHQIIISADISKMYRQILVCPDHRDYQRILYRNSIDSNISTYRLKTVTYGTTSAPYLAIRCLKELALTDGSQFPQAQSAILSDFYVDDLLTGAHTSEEATILAKQIKTILMKGGFELHKWASNDSHIMEAFQKQTNTPTAINLDKEGDTKTLGLLWNCNDDTLKYTIHTDESKCLTRVSKRLILSTIARFFDPLGLISPVFIKIKILLQTLWSLKLNWDESIPQELYQTWKQFITQIENLQLLSIPRKVIPDKLVNHIELHIFCDASEAAYGTCIYIKTIDHCDKHHAYLLCAKSRVSPLKNVSLPRLELCGALLGVRLSQKVLSSLKLQFKHIYYWTDSTVVLHWISKPSHIWKTFVANRVSEIQQFSDIEQWNHVSTTQNPADLVSRGLLPNHLISSTFWWHGPSWLATPMQNYPKFHSHAEMHHDNDSVEMKTKCLVNFTHEIDILHKFSNYNRLLRVIAFCKRFVHNSKFKHLKHQGNLTANELHQASIIIVKLVQKTSFNEELKNLTKGKCLDKSSKLLSLSAFLDEKGVIRVGGRLSNANILYDQRHPIVLPANHHISKLLIEREHIRQCHAGAQATLASLRQHYWILNGRNTVRHVLHKCIKCFRANPRNLSQKMGNLPLHRIEAVRPFNKCGVDYGGPISIKEGRGRGKRTTKAYICLFVCMCTKAIHLELVTDCTTEAFISTLHRFIARRGKPAHIFSDNGRNFVGANNELQQLRELLKTDKFYNQLTSELIPHNITWHFIPPSAPHFGGIWESGIKSVKTHMKRVTGNALLTYEEMNTLLTQIESCLNSRPLTPISSDPNDLEPLTPGHFLIGTALTHIPESDLTNVTVNRLSRWQYIQHLMQHFWRRWSKEYRSQLQQRSKWTTETINNLKIGSAVLIHDDNLPPLCWKMGRILELHPGKDGLLRVVTIKTISGTLKRAITKLCLFPID